MNLNSIIIKTKKYWIGVKQSQSYSWGEGTSLPLFGHPSDDGITMKTPYGGNVLFTPTRLALHLSLLTTRYIQFDRSN